MHKIILGFFFWMIISGGKSGDLWASDISISTPQEAFIPTPTLSNSQTPVVPIPIYLKDSEKIFDSENHSMPPSPEKNADGKTLQVQNSEHVPLEDFLNSLADPSLIPQIESFNKSDNKSRTYYWHSLNGTDYCHFRSGSGSQWYGWQWNGDFLWVLFHTKHFWWHDTYAGRWLYFDRSYWRWQGPKKNQFQVYLKNGHYYICGPDGTLGEDLFTTGREEDVSEPVVKETVVPLSKQNDSTTSGQGGLDSFNHQYQNH